MNVWLVVRTFISGIIILYIQILFMPRLAVAGITPNLFLGWIVYQVWSKPVKILIPIVFILGLCYDLTMPSLFGLQTIIFILLSVGVDEFHRPLEKESYITMGITLGLVCIIYSIIMSIANGIQSGFGIMLLPTFIWTFIYNLVWAVMITGLFVLISHLKLDFRHG